MWQVHPKSGKKVLSREVHRRDVVGTLGGNAWPGPCAECAVRETRFPTKGEQCRNRASHGTNRESSGGAVEERTGQVSAPQRMRGVVRGASILRKRRSNNKRVRHPRGGRDRDAQGVRGRQETRAFRKGQWNGNGAARRTIKEKSGRDAQGRSRWLAFRRGEKNVATWHTWNEAVHGTRAQGCGEAICRTGMGLRGGAVYETAGWGNGGGRRVQKTGDTQNEPGNGNGRRECSGVSSRRGRASTGGGGGSEAVHRPRREGLITLQSRKEKRDQGGECKPRPCTKQAFRPCARRGHEQNNAGGVSARRDRERNEAARERFTAGT